MDEVLGVYQEVAQYPSLASAQIVCAPDEETVVDSIWSQRNLGECKKQKFNQNFILRKDLTVQVKSFPIDVTSEIKTVSTDDGKLKAILRDVSMDRKSKQIIEIWDETHLSKSYDLSAFDVHGEIYSVEYFAAFCWSKDSKKLLYVAEKKLPTPKPFYEQKSKVHENGQGEADNSRGTEFLFKPDWGEQLTGKHRSVVAILDIEKDTITTMDSIPDEYFPSQVVWAPNDKDIVGVAYKLSKRYLGLFFCTSREAPVFYLKGGQFRILSTERVACRSPRFSPDGQFLVWLERNLSVAHHHVHRLMRLKWDTKGQPDALVDVVKTHRVIGDDKKFYGLYDFNLPRRCWSTDSKFLFLSTPQRFDVKSYIINAESKTLSEINNPNKSSLSILDVYNDIVAFNESSLIQPSQLVVAKFDSEALNSGQVTLHSCSKSSSPLGNSVTYDVSEFTHNLNESVRNFDFAYLGVNAGPAKSIPLIAVLHGGPHSQLSNEFSLPYAFFAALGYGVLLINYRGSTGYGGDTIDFLLGKVGSADTLDCVSAINATIKKYCWINPECINLFGGSHGGFLIAHLSGMYPDMFRAVVMRNPVIDVALTFNISDIPDWSPGESGYTSLGPLPETTPNANLPQLIQSMLSCSPILNSDKVKVPTLIALGSKDLRVPQSEGKLWYYKLCQNRVIAKLLVYDDNHSLNGDRTEIDFLINSVLWFKKHTTP
ncbi:hypothetical protein QAD02_012348 [Eretmocerus hayati]|uniref:Uncharacterized protein n=1 Tax=Eretmocerus hayati TaxID=131215 RepID=A0ACC2P0G3_9HYME|nr:hypothetical protein QAD02_012348 [Eretmocerus hayati]